MSTERTALADLLWELKNSGEGLSLKKMAGRTGGKVSVSTLHDVMSGKTKSLTDETVSGLAKLLNTSETRVIALHKGRPFSEDEEINETKTRLWEMYSDIPLQCQKDVMYLLEVMQRNHSISAHRGRHEERRDEAAVTASYPDLKLTYDGPTYSPVIPDGFFASHIQYLSSDEVRQLLATLPEKEGRELAQALPPEQVRAFGFGHLISEPETKPPHRQRKTG